MTDIRVALSDAFALSQVPIMEEYIAMIEDATYLHDQTFFIARKAICLMRALAKNGAFDTTNRATMWSSRALLYPTLVSLASRPAVVDDVCVTRATLEQVCGELRRRDGVSSCDVYIAAQGETAGAWDMDGVFFNGISTLPDEDVFSLVGSVTRYIQMSGVTCNSDQPMFAYRGKGVARAFLEGHHCVDIARTCQARRGITNATIVYDAPSFLSGHGFTAQELEEAVVKSRVFVDDASSQATVVPIVVLPALSAERIDALFQSLRSDEVAGTWDLVDAAKDVLTDDGFVESKARIVSYVLSVALGHRTCSSLWPTDGHEAGPDAELARTIFGLGTEDVILAGEHASVGDAIEVPSRGFSLRDLDNAVAMTDASLIEPIRSWHGESVSASDVVARATGIAAVNRGVSVAFGSAVLDVLLDECQLVPCPSFAVPGKRGLYQRRYHTGEIQVLTKWKISALADAIAEVEEGLAADGIGRLTTRQRCDLGVLFSRFQENRAPSSRSLERDSSAEILFTFRFDQPVFGGRRDPTAPLDALLDDARNDGFRPEAPAFEKDVFADAVLTLWDHWKAGGREPGSAGVAKMLNSVVMLDPRARTSETERVFDQAESYALRNTRDEVMRFAANIIDGLDFELEEITDRNTLLWLDEAMARNEIRPAYKHMLDTLMVSCADAEREDDGTSDTRAANDPEDKTRVVRREIGRYVYSYVYSLKTGDFQAAKLYGELARALIDATYDSFRFGEGGSTVTRRVGTITHLHEKNSYKIMLEDRSAEVRHLVWSSPVARGEDNGSLWYFLDRDTRPVFVCRNDWPSRAGHGERPSDISYVFPAWLRDAVAEESMRWAQKGRPVACVVMGSGNDDGVARARHDLIESMRVEGRGMRLVGDPRTCSLIPDAFVPDGPEPGYAPKPGTGVFWEVDYGESPKVVSISYATSGENSPIAGRDATLEL